MGLMMMMIASAFNRIIVEETIRTQEKICERPKRRHPEGLHDLLVWAFATRFEARRGGQEME